MSNLQTFKYEFVCFSSSNMFSCLDKVCILYCKTHAADCLYFYLSVFSIFTKLLHRSEVVESRSFSSYHITSEFDFFFSDQPMIPTLCLQSTSLYTLPTKPHCHPTEPCMSSLCLSVVVGHCEQDFRGFSTGVKECEHQVSANFAERVVSIKIKSGKGK